MLLRVIAPHFVAGLIVTKDKVTEAAPILSWAIGKNAIWCFQYFKKKGWSTSVINI